ncbi:uncharacterized protein LOC143373513 isoform X2 [Andrena cerasifolii]|uniref:uncharacterized protein LOC143373513 isoform X2 n=1 Tax=Andrena cerasifolii TaxID=2819439 RepID=UPI004037D25D
MIQETAALPRRACVPLLRFVREPLCRVVACVWPEIRAGTYSLRQSIATRAEEPAQVRECFLALFPVRRVQCEPRDRVPRKQVHIDVFQSSFQRFASGDTLETTERQPMNQAPRATMPQSTQRTFAGVIIVMMLVTGLVVAQKYTGHQRDPDSLVFPDFDDERSYSPANRPGRGSQLSKELQLAKEISTLDSMDEFLTLVRGVPKTEKTFINSRMGENEERSNAERPIPAKCMPELQPVSLKLETDPSSIYYPSCTRVKRCGGCCSHSLLSCQPTASEFRNFEVLVVSVDQSDGFHYRSKQIVPLEEHTKCMCDCRIKPEHCNSKQSYVEEECRCKCNNVDEQKKCIKNNDTKIWNPEQCTCFCREEQECSTGFYFDQNTCRCEQEEFDAY